jgi:hypothetical protein
MFWFLLIILEISSNELDESFNYSTNSSVDSDSKNLGKTWELVGIFYSNNVFSIKITTVLLIVN